MIRSSSQRRHGASSSPAAGNRLSSALAFALAALLWPGLAAGQWIDAQQPRQGEVQIGLTGSSATSDRRFLPDGSSQLLAEALGIELDRVVVPALDTLNATLAAVFSDLGLGTPESSTLGPVSYDVLLERTSLPLSVNLGVTDWLAPFVVIPFVKGKSFPVTQVDSSAANAGPSSTAFDGDADSFFNELDAGISALESIIAADTLPADLQSQAEGLLADAQTIQAGLQDIRDEEYAPTDSGGNGRALAGFYEDVRGGFNDLAVTLPELALAQPVDGSTAAALSSGPEFGIEEIMNTNTGWKLGDIELGVSVQPLNTFRLHREPKKLLIRGRFDALYRLATGTPPAASLLTAVGTGDGQPDLEFRTVWDVAWGRRFWLSAAFTYNIQFAADVERLVTDPASPIQLGAFTTPVRWDPGDIITLAAAPRFNLSRAITFSLLFAFKHRGVDKVMETVGTATDGAFSITEIERGTEYSTTSFGFAARYSATNWTGDGRRPALPAEIELRYRKTVSGSGGLAPRRSVWEVGVRYYVGILR